MHPAGLYKGEPWIIAPLRLNFNPGALQQATVRREWLRRLRQEGERQCIDLARPAHLGRHPDRQPTFAFQFCAMALLGEIVHGPQWWLRGGDVTEVGAKAGLDYMQVSKVVTMNDGGPCPWTGKMVRPHSFRQMSVIIERWFAAAPPPARIG